MSYKIDESLHCASNSYTAGRNHAIDYIVVHYTGGAGNARQNAVYFHNGGNGASSAHYFIDGLGVIYKSVWESDTAWHAGNWSMNCRSIGIEVCSDGEPFTPAEIKELHWLVREIMADYGIPASRVIRHYDVTGKLCPYPYINEGKWKALWETITAPFDPEGFEVCVWNSNGQTNQKWKLNRKGEFYEIESVAHPGYVLDAKGAGTKDGTPVLLWKRNDQPNQLWRLATDGIWTRIEPCYIEGMRLDVTGAVDTPGTRVELWTANDTPAQKFVAMEHGGIWQFVNDHPNKKLVLDVVGG